MFNASHLYEIIIYISWGAFILFWVVSAFNVKRDIRGGYSSMWKAFWLARIVAAIAILFVVIRVSTGKVHYSANVNVLSHIFFQPSPLVGWIAATLSVVGVSFAIWARVHLGRNWSPQPSVKEHHELVTTGPYAYVRHPIYTGVALMAFGAAMTGSIIGVCAFAFATMLFLLRIRKEEKIMLELFPTEYPAYQAKTKRLIPCIW